jgi:maleylpyruvate isomerase
VQPEPLGPTAAEQAALAASHRRLFAAIDGLADDAARRPSRLPGWSVGHVLTHLARNADSVTRRLAGAARGEVVDQYAGGPAGREAEIEAGAARPAAELVADVRESALACERAAAELPDDAWDRHGRSVEGDLHTMRRMLAGRIREVELHHVDLGLGYEPADWPPDFARAELDRALAHLTERVDPAALLGWLSGRGPAPELPPWP